MNIPLKVRSTLAGTLAFAAVITLSACQAESATDELKKNGKTSQQVDGETTWGGGEGPAYTPTPTLPSTFPVADIPLADGAIIDAGERAQGIWFVNVDAGNDSAMNTALDKLATAGFVTLSDEAVGTDRAVQLENARYTVNLLSIHGADTTTLSYDISSKTS
jgi:hypothetical protein